jgi:hypothetical protein
LEVIDLLQHNLGAGAHADVVGQVDPPDAARCVHQELGWAGNVAAIFAAAMQDSVAANHLGVGIGQKEESVTLVLAEFARLRAGIHAYGRDLHAARAKLV